MYQTAIKSYLKAHNLSSLSLRTILFDMDGVLFDSMPYHAKAWHNTMLELGFHLSEEEAYLHEGRTGAGTIDIVVKREQGRTATEEEKAAIYQRKSDLFNSYPQAERMPGSSELIAKLKANDLSVMIVTGSGQHSLLDRLNENFPNTFVRERMVTAFDVKHGKPNPEPYLMALQKGGLKPGEAIVVENAPLGVEAAVAAGIFTIAVNTGPLPNEVLQEAGANLIFPSMPALCEAWDDLYRGITQTIAE